ncbi:MAG: hypothetical protein KA007_00215 [Candidatus Pacebacteria bacterium]|nr:hypothetical protein [Candidatus Paceibacterota bacterium]
MKAADMLKMKDGSRIKVKTFFFGSEFISDLVENTKEGFLKEFDKDSEYCRWTDLNGVEQPYVHINSIELID